MNVEKSICIIGCGVSGLSALRVFSEKIDRYPINYSLTGYEKRSNVGGLWNFNEEINAKFVSPIYRDLKTNFPKELMNYPDFQFTRNLDKSFVHHTHVLNYFQDYAKHFNLEKFIEFNSEVVNLDSLIIENTLKWKVTIEKSSTTTEKLFDVVLICAGRFDKPHIPQITGISNFKGEYIHCKYYKFPETYSNKTVFVLGAKYSGIDIALQLVNVASQVYLSHNKAPLGWANVYHNLKETPGISHIDESGKISLVDGSQYEADNIIFCTGYEIDLSYLSNSVGLEFNNLNVRPLYKDIINPYFPTSFFVIGLGFEFLPIIHTYLQSKVARAIVQNCHKNIILSKETLMIAVQKDQEFYDKKADSNDYNVKQWPYIKWCIDVAQNIMTYNIPEYLENLFQTILKLRQENIYEYRNNVVQLDENSKFGFIIRGESNNN